VMTDIFMLFSIYVLLLEIDYCSIQEFCYSVIFMLFKQKYALLR